MADECLKLGEDRGVVELPPAQNLLGQGSEDPFSGQDVSSLSHLS